MIQKKPRNMSVVGHNENVFWYIFAFWDNLSCEKQNWHIYNFLITEFEMFESFSKLFKGLP